MPRTLDQFINEYTTRRQEAFAVLRDTPTIFFIGAGVGYGIYPLWDDLVRSLLERAELNPPENFAKLTPPQKAQWIKDQNEAVYRAGVLDHFQKYKPNVARLIQHIKKLRMSGIITTNYDDAIDEEVEDLDFNSVALDKIHSTMLLGKQKSVFHIHGYIDSRKDGDGELNIILTEEEYKHFYETEPIISDFLRTAFKEFNIIFVGFSLNDPYVTKIIKEIRSIEDSNLRRGTGQLPKKRYAFTAIEVEEIKGMHGRHALDWEYLEGTERKLEEYGITPVWYEKGEEHRGLNDLLRSWSRELSTRIDRVGEKFPENP